KLSIKSVGVNRYASHPSTEVVWIAFAVDDQPVQLVRPSDGVPPEFIEAAHNPNWTVEAHNDSFEMLIERYIHGSLGRQNHRLISDHGRHAGQDDAGPAGAYPAAEAGVRQRSDCVGAEAGADNAGFGRLRR